LIKIMGFYKTLTEKISYNYKNGIRFAKELI